MHDTVQMSNFVQGEGEDVDRPQEGGSEVEASAEDNFCVLPEEDDDSDDSEQETVHIQLGFAEKVEDTSSMKWLYEDPDWTNWDGGKIGGKPIWLNPVSIPDSKSLQCASCQEPLLFLLQVYCPLDNVQHAFHRGLYVFCCQKKSCINAGGLKCLRVQLPEHNDFYCENPETDPQFKDSSISKPSLCALCGCRAGNVCSGCKKVSYCSRSHQKLHWKYHKKACKGEDADIDSSAAEYLFPEYEIVVEPEEESAVPSESIKTSNSAETEIWEDAMTPGGRDEASDAALTQADYNKALSEQRYDPTYVSFLTRIANGGSDQVFRYCEDSLHRHIKSHVSLEDREKGRLYLSTDAKKNANKLNIPACPHCGAARVLECQIMPQLLHFLHVEKNTELIKTIVPKESSEVSINKDESGATPDATQEPANAVDVKGIMKNNKEDDLDWGTIDVYTCVASCPGSQYLEEFLVIQDLPESEQLPAELKR